MNIRQQIVDHLKSQKNATIASVAKATEIDRTVVRYHLRAMAKLGFARVGKGTSGPNGSAAASILDGKKAAAVAAEWTPRARTLRGLPGKRKISARSLGGGKGGGKRQNGIGTSPKLANGHGEVYLVTRDAQMQNEAILAVSVFSDKEEAIAAVVAGAGAGCVIYAARRLEVVHTVVEA